MIIRTRQLLLLPFLHLNSLSSLTFATRRCSWQALNNRNDKYTTTRPLTLCAGLACSCALDLGQTLLLRLGTWRLQPCFGLIKVLADNSSSRLILATQTDKQKGIDRCAVSSALTGRFVMEDSPSLPRPSESTIHETAPRPANMSMLATANPSPHPSFGTPRPWEVTRCPDYSLRPRTENDRVALPSIRQVRVTRAP